MLAIGCHERKFSILSCIVCKYAALKTLLFARKLDLNIEIDRSSFAWVILVQMFWLSTLCNACRTEMLWCALLCHFIVHVLLEQVCFRSPVAGLPASSIWIYDSIIPAGTAAQSLSAFDEYCHQNSYILRYDKQGICYVPLVFCTNELFINCSHALRHKFVCDLTTSSIITAQIILSAHILGARILLALQLSDSFVYFMMCCAWKKLQWWR